LSLANNGLKLTAAQSKIRWLRGLSLLVMRTS
jgi:hypothetical protein